MVHKKVLIKQSGKTGRGLFLNEKVKKGTKVVTFEGPVVNNAEAHALGHENHVVPVGIDKYIDVSEPESLINHSCEPSMGFSTDRTLIALGDLKVGDEITFDYSMVTVDDWEMACLCGTKSCRGRISNFKDLPVK